jgi:hypothetical protein
VQEDPAQLVTGAVHAPPLQSRVPQQSRSPAQAWPSERQAALQKSGSPGKFAPQNGSVAQQPPPACPAVQASPAQLGAAQIPPWQRSPAQACPVSKQALAQVVAPPARLPQ